MPGCDVQSPSKAITHSCKLIVKKLSDHNAWWYVSTIFVIFFNIMYTKNATGSLGTPIVNRNSVLYSYCKCPRTAVENWYWNINRMMVRFIYLCQLCILAELSELHKCLQQLRCLHFVNCEKSFKPTRKKLRPAKNLVLGTTLLHKW